MIDPKTITKDKFIIFMPVAFGAAAIPMWAAGYMLSIGNTIAFLFLFRMVAVFIPLLAVFCSGAGFKDLGFKPKRPALIPVALLAPQILSWIGTAVYLALFSDGFKIGFDAFLSQLPSDITNLADFSSIDPTMYLIVMIVMSLTFIPISQILFSFGEEAGWRGVMYPYFKEHFGKNIGRIIGGALWGVWHWPLIILGNYFYGNEYPGYPVLGPVMICIALIAYGFLIDWLYEKTGSIIIASLAHSAMNASAMPLILIVTASSNEILGPSAFALFPVIPVIIVAVLISISKK